MHRIGLWTLGAGLAGAVALAGIVLTRTMLFATPPPETAAPAPDFPTFSFDRDAAVARLSAAIRINTVSLADEAADDPQGFAGFHAWLAASYPAFHSATRLEKFGGWSLLYTWEGSDPGLPPIILLAHQDTVPVPPDTIAGWHAEPLGGELRDGYVWGRGTLDDKASLVAMLEAAEAIAASGRSPQRTLIMAFGHDEELGGARGAVTMAGLLASRGVRAWFALDEGMAAVREHPLTGRMAALIGVSEKGSGTLRVRAAAEPGHSSMPPRETAVSLLAAAVTRVHGMQIDRSIAGGPAEPMMRALGEQMAPMTRLAVANEWLFAPLLRARLAEDRAAQALLGTTVAPTVISGGSRNNVLPGEAVAHINLRIHPRDNPDDLLARARAAVAGMPGVTVDWAGSPRPASPVASVDSDSYALLAALSRAVLPEAPVAPGLVLGGTDARHYAGVADNVYRYLPLLLDASDWETIHGLNERISVENFERLVRFYAGLMEAGAFVTR